MGYANKDPSDPELKPKELKINVRSQAICSTDYTVSQTNDKYSIIQTTLPQSFNHSAIVCAGDRSSDDGTCPGDSGKNFTGLEAWPSKLGYSKTPPHLDG